MAERSFGGYAYQQRLEAGVFGDVYRALTGAGVEARIIDVDPKLATRSVFARALVNVGERLLPLEHPRIVRVREVGQSGEQMVVVTDPVAGQVVLRDLLRGEGLPLDVALAIGVAAIEGLAKAHGLGIVHGAVHPRSVLIDRQGGVKLADFGLAWALVEAAVDSDDTALLRGLRGYLAPELALGQPANELSDVYSAGALLFQLLRGEPPPGELRAPPLLKRVIERALSIDVDKRILHAGDLEERLDEAISVDGCHVASADEVARFVLQRLAVSDDALHAATDDLVAGLPPARVEVPSATPAPRIGRVTDVLARLEEDARAGERPAAEDRTEIARTALDESELFDILHPELDVAAEDSARVRAVRSSDGSGPERTPLPSSAPRGVASIGRDTPPPRVVSIVKDPGLVERPEVDRDGPTVIAPPSTAPLHQDEQDLVLSPRRSRAILWIGVTAFAASGLGAILYTQTDLFDPGRRAAEVRADKEAQEAAIAQHEAAQPRAADVTIVSPEADAAVWLLLGRTPVDSMSLSSSMVHELRVEHEGYQPVDVRVTGYQWKEAASGPRAEVGVELAQGEPRRPVPPYPAAPSGAGAEPPAGPRGRGVVHVESRPVGAQVWLLIGFTPRATISGLEVGKDYELKILKAGFRPAFAAVRAGDWFLSGPQGPTLTSLTREVSLIAIERPVKARKRAPSKQASRPAPSR